RRQGYEVATAANGEEALGWLMLHPFDLLLINPTLPGLSGLELAQCARHCQPVAKVLFLSGQGEERVVQIDYLHTIASSEYVLGHVATTLLGSIELQLAA
ncbi:MAG TPA: response regulator, partial [Roseiflexaceae bacterium]